MASGGSSTLAPPKAFLARTARVVTARYRGYTDSYTLNQVLDGYHHYIINSIMLVS
eukprot:SAG31_NODE_1584_length_7827_cov_2.129788_2_plen_56_part_00